jgi:hypothetical protein
MKGVMTFNNGKNRGGSSEKICEQKSKQKNLRFAYKKTYVMCVPRD